jgi:hypothetical protein
MENLNNQNQPTVTVGDWVITIFLMAIPIVGLVMLFVWAFGSGTNPNKANFAKAALIWMAIAIVLTILLTVVFGIGMFALFNR